MHLQLHATAVAVVLLTNTVTQHRVVNAIGRYVDILSVSKKTTLGLFQNAIEISTVDQVRWRFSRNVVDVYTCSC